VHVLRQLPILTTGAHNHHTQTPQFHVLVTSYNLCMTDSGWLARFPWACCVVDEAHRLKSQTSKLYLSLLTEFKINLKILLTGTPVQVVSVGRTCGKNDVGHVLIHGVVIARGNQNNLRELHALLAFINPRLFNDADAFVKYFTPPKSDKSGARTRHTTQLHTILLPFLLRRTIKDVSLKLPPLTEIVVRCELSPMQRKWYRAVLTGNVDALVDQKQAGLMNIIMQLRKVGLKCLIAACWCFYTPLTSPHVFDLQVCNHPYLFDGAEPEPFVEGDHIWQNSGKLFLLDHLLPKLQSDGHKVLLFSQSTRMLDVVRVHVGTQPSWNLTFGSVRFGWQVQDYLAYRNMSYERLDGSVRGEER